MEQTHEILQFERSCYQGLLWTLCGHPALIKCQPSLLQGVCFNLRINHGCADIPVPHKIFYDLNWNARMDFIYFAILLARFSKY